MRYMLSAVLAVITVAACTSEEEARVSAAIELGNRQLKDPDSAKWDCKWTTSRSASQEERYAAEGPILECRVRAKNNFGGYGNDVSFDFLFFDTGHKVLKAYYFDTSAGYVGTWRQIG